MSASPIATLFVAPLSGAFSDRIGTRPLAVAGMMVCALGLFMLSGLTADDGAWDVAWRLALVGLGSGLFQSPNNSAVMGSVPPPHLGIASGILAAMRNVGMVLGIAVAGAVLYSYAPTVAYVRPGSYGAAEIEQFLNGLRAAYVTGAGMALAAAVMSWLAAVKRQDDEE